MATAPNSITERSDPAQPSVRSSQAVRRKKLVRRTDREYSQDLRLGFQLAFLTPNIWIGVQFYQWVR
jgi:hypothetical protein